MPMETELERMVVRLRGDSTHYIAMLRTAQAATLKAAQSLTSVGTRLTASLSVPLGIIGGLSVKAFSDFDQAMTETAAKMGGPSRQVLDQLSELNKQMSLTGETTFSPTELAKGMEALAGAGIDDAARLAKIMPEMARFAQAGAFDMETATKSMIGALAGFRKLSQDPLELAQNMTRFSDVMVEAARQTQVDVLDMAVAMSGDASSAARNYGMTVEELAGILAVYAKQNIKAEEASNLAGRMTRLLTASFVKNKKVWVEMVGDITDGNGQFRDFGTVLSMVSTALDKFSPEEKVKVLAKLGFETLAQKSIMPLLGQQDQFKQFVKDFQKTGATAEMANTQMQSFAAGMKVVRNNLLTLAIEVGQRLAPVLQFIGEQIKGLLVWWRGLSDGGKQLTVIVGGLVVALGPLLIVTGLLVKTLGLLVVGPMVAGIQALAGAFMLMLSPVGLVTAAVVGLGAALLKWTGAGEVVADRLGKKLGGLAADASVGIQGVKDAMTAGDLALAAEIAWTQVKLTLVKATASMRQEWAAVVLFFKETWIDATSTIQQAWASTTDAIAVNIAIMSEMFGLAPTGTIEAVVEDHDNAIKQMERDRKASLRRVQADALDTYQAVEADLNRLTAERDRLAGEAAAKAAAKTAAQAAGATAGANMTAAAAVQQGIQQGLQAMPPLRVPVATVLSVEAVEFGSAEAMSRLSAFQEFRMDPTGGKGRADEMDEVGEEQLAVQKDIRDGIKRLGARPEIEISEAGLV